MPGEVLSIEHRGETLTAVVDHGCGPDDTYYRIYRAGEYVGWIHQVGDLQAGLFVSQADGTPRSQADQLDLLLRAAGPRGLIRG